jgi:hypothetical protein
MRHPSGKVSLGGLVFLTLIAGAIYAAVLVVPLYVDHLTVKEAVTVAHNLAGKNYSDDMLRNTIRDRTSQIGQHWGRDRFDNEELVPGLGLTDEEIVIERNEVNQYVRINVSYDREVQLKPTDIVRTLHFSAVKEGIPGQ